MNLKNDALVVAGISGGKDSTALALWLVHESGIPRDRIILQFCDTGNEDEFTYRFLDILEKSVGPIQRVKPDRDFWELAVHKRRFPGRKARFCTSDLKVKPGQREIVKIKASAESRGLEVVKATGSRHEEAHNGNERGDLPEIAWDAFVIDRETHAYQVWYPMREWAIEDIWAIHTKYLNMIDVVAMVALDPEMEDGPKADLLKNMESARIPRNPLYDMGAKRVGCFPCINSRKMEIRAMDHYRPERAEFIAQREENDFLERSNYSYSSMFPRKTVPVQFRSKKLIDRRTGEPVLDKDGSPMMVCTIHDVVDWSKTRWGGKQYEAFLPEEAAEVCMIGGECE